MAKGKKKTTVHKHTPNLERKNGKSWKQYPQAFDTEKRRLVTVGDTMKGTSGVFLKS